VEKVRKFSVSKSLLVDADGNADTSVIQLCYQVKEVLNKYYLQWRIEIKPANFTIKLQDRLGIVVLDTEFDEDNLLIDWHELLSYEVMAPVYIDAESMFASA